MTRDDVRAYLAGLSPDAKDLFRLADTMARDIEDTLTEEFQLAASVVKLFWERAQRFKESHES